MSSDLSIRLVCGISNYNSDRHGRPWESWVEDGQERVTLLPVRSLEELQAANASPEDYDREALKIAANECLTDDQRQPQPVCSVFTHPISDDDLPVSGLVVDESNWRDHPWIVALMICYPKFQTPGLIDVPKYPPPKSVPPQNHHMLPEYLFFTPHQVSAYKLAAWHLFTIAGMMVNPADIKLILHWDIK